MPDATVQVIDKHPNEKFPSRIVDDIRTVDGANPQFWWIVYEKRYPWLWAGNFTIIEGFYEDTVLVRILGQLPEIYELASFLGKQGQI
jgi:hypothetical protein